MEQYIATLNDLYNRIPRRHSSENLQLINAVLDEYTDVLGKVEATSPWFEKSAAAFYPSLESIQANIKMSNSSKHAKKAKDNLFDDASGQLKDDIQSLIQALQEGEPR